MTFSTKIQNHTVLVEIITTKNGHVSLANNLHLRLSPEENH